MEVTNQYEISASPTIKMFNFQNSQSVEIKKVEKIDSDWPKIIESKPAHQMLKSATQLPILSLEKTEKNTEFKETTSKSET